MPQTNTQSFVLDSGRVGEAPQVWHQQDSPLQASQSQAGHGCSQVVEAGVIVVLVAGTVTAVAASAVVEENSGYSKNC